MSGESLLKVINDILDFSRISAGKLMLEFSEFDLFTTVDDVVQLLLSEAKEKGLELTVEYPPDLPRWVVGDAGRLRQVLMNLVGNAVKFTHEGEVTITVDCERQNDTQGMFRVAVADTGIGIAKRHLSDIFEKFVRVEEKSAFNYSGTGLGLSISKQLLELIGGTLQAESEYGVGSVFSFELPLPFAAEEKVPREEPVTPDDSEKTLPARVLLAEDDPVNQIVARKILEIYGCDVTVVENGQEAVEALEKDRYDIVFMDARMPVMDGFEATAEIRRRDRETNRHTPIVAMTAHALEGAEEKCLAAGMDGYVSKPISHDAVWKMISTWYQPKKS